MEKKLSGLQRAINAANKLENGDGVGILAHAINVKRKTVLAWLREDGTPHGSGAPLPDNKVTEAVGKAGGVPSLARVLGVTPQAVREWVRCGHVPPARAKEVEMLYGIPRIELVSSKVRNVLGVGGEL